MIAALLAGQHLQKKLVGNLFFQNNPCLIIIQYYRNPPPFDYGKVVASWRETVALYCWRTRKSFSVMHLSYGEINLRRVWTNPPTHCLDWEESLEKKDSSVVADVAVRSYLSLDSLRLDYFVDNSVRKRYYFVQIHWRNYCYCYFLTPHHSHYCLESGVKNLHYWREQYENCDGLAWSVGDELHFGYQLGDVDCCYYC